MLYSWNKAVIILLLLDMPGWTLCVNVDWRTEISDGNQCLTVVKQAWQKQTIHSDLGKNSCPLFSYKDSVESQSKTPLHQTWQHIRHEQTMWIHNDTRLSPVKRICVFEHSVMTNFNCVCPAIQRGQGSGFLSECSSWLTACMSEQRRFWRDCADAQARLNLRCSHRR